ncbi:M28 family peptidase [Pelomyxa schiedti]|nr:M28 family peptidase [Pelomyxa schiedti]
MLRNSLILTVVAAVGVTIVILCAATALFVRQNRSKHDLVDTIELEGLWNHLEKLQEIADSTGGTRASFTLGFNESMSYVMKKLEDSGLAISTQTFSFSYWTVIGTPELSEVQPTPITFSFVDDFTVLKFSASGNFTAPLSVIQNLGCCQQDYAGFSVGNIALIYRGNCTINEKLTLALQNSASAVLIYNSDTESGPYNVSTGGCSIPVFGLSFSVGVQLTKESDILLSLNVITEYLIGSSTNILAETTTGNASRAVVVGAHLDGGAQGPGINDNGSGASALLEMAIHFKSSKTFRELINKVVFAFWGAEENGLQGSKSYIQNRQSYPYTVAAYILSFVI